MAKQNITKKSIHLTTKWEHSNLILFFLNGKTLNHENGNTLIHQRTWQNS
jgi:hypothetical protein